MLLTNILLLGGLTISVAAHPKLSARELEAHHEHHKRTTEALHQCLQTRELKDINADVAKQQAESLKQVLRKRGMKQGPRVKRDKASLLKWASHSHEHTDHPSPDIQSLFGFSWDKEPSRKPALCALSPESIFGPYWLDGHPERADIRDGQEGVYMRLALQVIDVSSCLPLGEHARIDVWHANAHGDYGPTNTSFLRGQQTLSKHGTAEFDSIFPGWYAGRSIHIHTVVRPRQDKHVIHTGMLYFDEWPRINIQERPEYKANPNQIIPTVEDGWAPASSSDKYDPFFQWSWLGDWPDYEGVLAWIAIGVNTSAEVPQHDGGKRSLLSDHLKG